MAPHSSADRFVRSAGRIALTLLLMIFVFEIGVMLILNVILPDGTSPYTGALIDAGLLTLFCAPVLHWLIVLPLRRSMLRERSFSDAILSRAANAIITIDEKGIVHSYNQSATKMFGYSASEMLGQKVKMLMPAPHSEEHDGYL